MHKYSQVADLSERLEEEEATNEQLSAAKRKLEKQNDDLQHDVEDLESNVSRLEKDKQVSFVSCTCLNRFHLLQVFYRYSNLLYVPVIRT